MSQPTHLKEKPALWTKNFILISLATFFIFSAFQILLPIMPKYAASLGAEKKTLGMVNGFFTLAALFFRPFMGRECDKKGRKGIYLIGIAVFFSAVFGYIWVPSVLLLLSLRVIHGLGWSATSTAAGTIVADILPASRRGEGMGYYGLFSTLSMAIAPALGLTILSHYNYSLVFASSLILTFIALLAGASLKLPPLNLSSDDDRGKTVTPINNRKMFKVASVMFFLTLTYGGIVTFLPLYAEEQGITNIGLFFTIYAFSLLITRPLSGRYYDQKGANLLVMGGMFFVFLAMLILFRAQSLAFFLTSGVLYGLGFGSIQPTMLALAVEGIHPQRRGIVNAIVMSAFDLGIGLGSLAFGFVADAYSYSFMYLCMAFFPFIGLLLFFWPQKIPKTG